MLSQAKHAVGSRRSGTRCLDTRCLDLELEHVDLELVAPLTARSPVSWQPFVLPEPAWKFSTRNTLHQHSQHIHKHNGTYQVVKRSPFEGRCV
jgi:hypothetical protein